MFRRNASGASPDKRGIGVTRSISRPSWNRLARAGRLSESRSGRHYALLLSAKLGALPNAAVPVLAIVARSAAARTGYGLPEGLAQPGRDQLLDERAWQWRINGELKCPGRSLVVGEFVTKFGDDRAAVR